MREPEGYSVTTLPGARAIERDTTTCGHCNAISFTERVAGRPQVLVFKADGTHRLHDVIRCRSCWRYICPRCDGKDCQPFEAYLDRIEKQAQFACL